MRNIRRHRIPLWTVVTFSILLVWPVAALMAQQDTHAVASAPENVNADRPQLTPRGSQQSIDDRYRMGPGDMLEITVFDYSQLSRQVRIDGNGMIEMPLLDGPIPAACRTPDELEADLSKRYLEYLKRPQIQVLVKEFSSQPVMIVGAVTKTGTTLQLQRRVRLREVLALAGGLSPTASQNVQIIHDDGYVRLCGGDNPGDKAPSAEEISYVDVHQPQQDPYLNPGDIVNVPDADQAFIVGNVFRPSTITLNRETTLSRALAMAGGTLPDSKSKEIRIFRHINGTIGNTQILVNLDLINRNKSEDPVLRAGDIVLVPDSELKKFAKNIGASVASVWAGYGMLSIIK